MSSPAEIIRQRSPLIVRSLLKASDAVEQMAHDFNELVVIKGGVEADDLQVIGWTQAQINKHGSEARTLGLQQMVRETEHVRQRRPRRRAA